MKLDINILKEDAKQFEEYENLRKNFELNGEFTNDQDPVIEGSYKPVDDTFPYIRKGFNWWLKQVIYNKVYNAYGKKINKQFTNLKVVGRENLKKVKASIVTCNHVSKVDSFAVRAALKENPMFVAAEFNNWQNALGNIMRNTGYIALPSTLNLKYMRRFNEAIEYYLKRRKKILIYPEQAMWREYKQPRPLQNGAFHYAVLNNVPILPLFITIEDKAEKVDSNGKMNFGDYTVHILSPIYPKPELTAKENKKFMRLENYRLWKECYEKTYNKKIKYTTKKEIWNTKFSEYDNI